MEYFKSRIHFYCEVLAGITIMMLLWLSSYLYLKVEILTMDCGDFAFSSLDPQEALRTGNDGLDGDRDGVACE